MNTFTITFRDGLGELKTEDFKLEFHSVIGIELWFLDILGLRTISITKH